MRMTRAPRVAFVTCLLASVASCSPYPGWHQRQVRSFLESRQDKTVMQHWDISCGAAALATLLTYQHGDPVSEREAALGMLRQTSPELVRQRLGFSLLDLKHFVKGRGYDADGYGELTLMDLQKLAPAIVPVRIRGNNHFVVFRGMQGDRVLVADPAFGGRTMPVDKFIAMWQGRIGFTVTRHDGKPAPNQLAVHPSDFWASSVTARSEKVVMAAMREEEIYEAQASAARAAEKAKASAPVAAAATPPQASRSPAAPAAKASASVTAAIADGSAPAGDAARSLPLPRATAQQMATTGAGPAARPIVAPFAGWSAPSATPEPPIAAATATSSRSAAIVVVPLPPPPGEAASSKAVPTANAKQQRRGAVDTAAKAKGAPMEQHPGPDTQQNMTTATFLLHRGNELLAAGDVAAARLFFMRAAQLGSPHAATMVGKTYDPEVFRTAGIVGLQPDAALAREWYRRGAGNGDAEAGIRLAALN
jgi:uncharacterized protein